MAVFKRGNNIYWFGFMWRGQRIQQSTKQTNRQAAREIEAAFRTRLAKGEVGIAEQAPVPMYADFAKRFEKEMESIHAAKPATVIYYKNSLKMLGTYKPLQNARLDRIDAEMIAAYVRTRRATKCRRKRGFVGVAAVNRELEVLRHLLRVAVEWNVLARAPKISLRPGEVGRKFVLNHAEEAAYLAAATRDPLRTIATSMLDGGFRPEEISRARWENVHFQPVGKALYGYIHVPDGKTDYAKRNVSMTARVKALLEMRWEKQGRPTEGWVFPSKKSVSGHIGRLTKQHNRALRVAGLKHFDIYSFRHTMLTRLGEAGADCYAIQNIAGHGSILLSQRYVHPTPEKIEGAFTKSQEYNAEQESKLKAEQESEQCSVQ